MKYVQAHRVVYCEPGSDASARGVDVEVDGFGGFLGFKEEELGNDERRVSVSYLNVEDANILAEV